jgi:hypothetical protein
MKNYKVIFIISIAFFFAFEATAQKALSEGKVVYQITYPDMELDSKMSSMLPKESVLYFKANKTRTETSMGMGISSASITDSKSGSVTTLMDMMGNKIAMVLTPEELKNMKKGGEEDVQIIQEKETKVIAGYTCNRTTIKQKDGNSFELYYTDRINTTSQLNEQYKNLKGFPMEYSVNQKGLQMKMVATSVTDEKVPDSLFKISDGYQVKTMEEMMKMIGTEGE